jgi:hypothetical protein
MTLWSKRGGFQEDNHFPFSPEKVLIRKLRRRKEGAWRN